MSDTSTIASLATAAGTLILAVAALRERDDPLYGPLCEAIEAGERIVVDLLYGDHDGRQRTITRFSLTPREQGDEDEPWLWACTTSRHWNLDRADPR